MTSFSPHGQKQLDLLESLTSAEQAAERAIKQGSSFSIPTSPIQAESRKWRKRKWINEECLVRYKRWTSSGDSQMHQRKTQHHQQTGTPLTKPLKLTCFYELPV